MTSGSSDERTWALAGMDAIVILPPIAILALVLVGWVGSRVLCRRRPPPKRTWPKRHID
jgi:hypothetical protein